MTSSRSLPFLVQPVDKGATHEIILVHAFSSGPNTPSRQLDCRHILESWVIRATAAIQSRVHVRVFASDGPHILSAGPGALAHAAKALLRAIRAMSVEPTSPLFHPGGKGTPYPSRAAVFVAHGLGIWVLKDALRRLDESGEWFVPARLVFADMPPLQLQQQTPVDPYADDAPLVEYLREMCAFFHLPAGRKSALRKELGDLRDNLLEIDGHFRALAVDQYGECEEYNESEHGRNTFTLFLHCASIWMSKRAFLKSAIKAFFRRIADFFTGKDKHARMESQIQALQKLKLDEVLEDTVKAESSRAPKDADPAPPYPPHMGEERGGMEGRQDSPRTPPYRPSLPNPLPGIPEDSQAQQTPQPPDYYFHDKEYAAAISLCHGADSKTPEGKAAILEAKQRLENILSEQTQDLGAHHPKTARTICAIVKTSLLAEMWTLKDLETMESDIGMAQHDLEEEGKKPYDEHVLEALFLLLQLRVLLWDNVKHDLEKATSCWAQLLEVRDTLHTRLTSHECNTPTRLLDTLRCRYVLARIFDRLKGETQMLTQLFADTDVLVPTVDDDTLYDLSALRAKIKDRIEEIQRLKRQIREPQE
ncbi:hypothetical protein F4779DRAFT_277496 [Xylariaceae sp. FL0662B]|nr:hypothetical protein F4779DRAFT_277496 [Xylariaceae sp. FL0662B]